MMRFTTKQKRALTRKNEVKKEILGRVHFFSFLTFLKRQVSLNTNTTALLSIIYIASKGFSHLFQCSDLPPARAFPYVDKWWPPVA